VARTADRLAVAGLYSGGFLGPFGGGVVSAMLPELGATFGVGVTEASASLTAFLLPFGLVMLVSGGLGERWGVRRTVVLAYLAYFLASLLCVVAAGYGLFPAFLTGRALQGLANSFFMPLLLSGIAAITPPERLGRALGLYGSLNAAGQTSAPLVGGLAAEVDWRWAFVGVAVVALALAVLGVPAGAERPGPEAGTGREADPGPEAGTGRRAGSDAGAAGRAREARRSRAWSPLAIRAGVVAAAGWGSLGGLGYLVALRMQDVFELGAGLRGLLLTGFGLAGVVTARLVGGAIDRIGARRCVLAGGVAGGVLMFGVGASPSLPLLAALWAGAGVASQFVLVGLNTLVLTNTPADRRGGAVSIVQALRFLGGGAAPTVVTPVYAMAPLAGFVLPATALVAALALVPRAPSASAGDAR
jgi:MFS family permease